MADEFIYRAQDVSYLGFLETQLRDMQGVATLAYELIQNADDVTGAAGEGGSSWISFDVRDEALVVENDGVFRPVDFERLQTIAGGGKRAEAGTTGAFGLGFLAVYQVTDAPEIFSGARHWTIHPEAAPGERIRERAAETGGTRLRLPWATDPESAVRRALRLPAIRPDALDELAHSIGQSLELAALFLGRLRVLTVKRAGQVMRQIKRTEEKTPTTPGHRLVLQDEKGQSAPWLLLEGDFAASASELRAAHPQIEQERSSRIQLALPLETMARQGRLFAGLPTETRSPLPFHVNASFFPTSDRKRIHLDGGYQAAWNEMALDAAAGVLAASLEVVRQQVDPGTFWQLLHQIAHTSELATQGELPGIFTTFWKAVTPLFAELPLLYTVQEEWVKTADGRVAVDTLPESTVAILREAGVPLAHPTLAPAFALLRRAEVGVPSLSLADLIEALKQVGLSRSTPLHEAPAFLNNLEALRALWQLFERLTEPHAPPEARAQERRLLNQVAFMLDDLMTLQRPDRVFRGNAEVRSLFPDVAWIHPHVPERGFPGRLVATFGARQAVERLAELPADQLEERWRMGRLDLPSLFRWFEAQQIEIFADDPALQKEIRRLPLCPVAGELRPLAHLYIPGGFSDPLGLAGMVPLDAVGGRRQFLEDLGVDALSFDSYLHRELPRVLSQQPDLASDARHRLLRLLAERLGEFRDDGTLQEQLSRLPLIPCLDGSFRPGGEVYATRAALALLGDGTHVAEPPPTEALTVLYSWLGVREEPAAADLLQRLAALGEEAAASPHPPGPEMMATVQECWQRLQRSLERREIGAAALTGLQKKAVIPAGPQRLLRPDQIFLADAPAVAAHFPDLAPYLVASGQETEQAWTLAGVRPLSTAVTVHVNTPAGTEPAPAIQKRLAGRLPLIRRIVQAEENGESRLDFLEKLRVQTADPLLVHYRLAVGGEARLSSPEKVQALLDRQENLLYIAGGEQLPWLAIAREIAQAIRGRQTAGGLALALKEVLAAGTIAAAGQLLDELGYPA